MRPVVKGDWPTSDGEPIEFSEYGDARRYLIDQLGDFCSYCENQITNPAVEHEQPKSSSPAISKNWYNLLLACVNCNSIKNDKEFLIEELYWPDVHNTFLLFDYHSMGAVTIKTTINGSFDSNIAKKTLELTGLDRFGNQISTADRRWIKRSETFGKATNSLKFYQDFGKPEAYIQSIIDIATSTGFWSIWMQVFKEEPEVIESLIEAFPNTYDGCETTNINRL